MFKKESKKCPPLFLAPMEGVGDRAFRRAMATIGGFDQACTEFLRVPLKPHVSSLVKNYEASEVFPIPLTVQLMGSDPFFMAEASGELERRGAPRIDLNCGCPSSTVTGHGAGSSLLKNPNLLYEIAKSMVSAVSIPVTVKLRSGFDDLSLFRENLFAAQSSGIQFLTLHPRTTREGYTPPAQWNLIAEAKSILKIPVVGNGDICSLLDALQMLKQTSCDGLMIGRGAITNPWIFREIQCYFSQQPFQKSWDEQLKFLEVFVENLSVESPLKNRIGKLKQLMGFHFKRTPCLVESRQTMLRQTYTSVEEFLGYILPLLRNAWKKEAISGKT